MSETDENSDRLKEILVALDHSYHSRAALEYAAFIAQLMEAKIHGIFVHDDRWLRISKLPTLIEIDELTGSISSVGGKRVEEEIRSLEKTIQDYFELISRQHELSHTWSAVKGAVAEEILEASKESDIITIGSRGRSFRKSRKIGSTAFTVLRAAEKPVLILQEKHTPGRSPVVVFDGSERSLSGLSIATTIAKKNDLSLVIIDISDAFPSEENSRLNLSDELRSRENVSILELDQPDIGAFLLMVNRRSGDILILPKNKRFTDRKVLEHILDSANCPVLLAG